MTKPLAVTGSTGYVGGAVARMLANDGHELRLPVRDVTRAPQLKGAPAVAFSYSDKPASIAALEGTEILFMVSAGEAEDRVDQHRTFIDAANEAGVKHVIYTSFLGAGEDSVFTLGRDHWATEEHLRQSGMDFTILRDNFYLDVLPKFAGDDGVIRGPAGDGRVSAVARDDVARTAVVVLKNPAAHAGRTYDLTGPEAFTLAEAAAVITTATGRSVRYQPETSDEAYASRSHYGAPRWQLDAWVSTYSAIATGKLAGTTTAVQDLTGRPPLSLLDFLKN